MPNIKIFSTIPSTFKIIDEFAKDSQIANRTAVSRTAFLAREGLTNQLKKKLDDPVPFIFRAYSYKRATSLEKPVARFFVIDKKRQQYIKSTVDTGVHIVSNLSLWGRRVGVLRGNEIFVPTGAFKRDSKGNIGASKARQLRRKGWVKRSGEGRGIWLGTGDRAVKMLHPVKVPSPYDPPVDADKFVMRFVPTVLQEEYSKAFKKRRDKTLKSTPRKLIRVGTGLFF